LEALEPGRTLAGKGTLLTGPALRFQRREAERVEPRDAAQRHVAVPGGGGFREAHRIAGYDGAQETQCPGHRVGADVYGIRGRCRDQCGGQEAERNDQSLHHALLRRCR
jgi:hypothetical protein